MKSIHPVIKMMSGKKGQLASIIGVLFGYLAMKGYIGQEEYLAIGAIQTALFGTASYMTKKAYDAKK